MVINLIYRTAEEKEDWIQARITLALAKYTHTQPVFHTEFWAYAFGSSAY